MKYETPELTALTPAISAIQTVTPANKPSPTLGDGPTIHNEAAGAYADWE